MEDIDELAGSTPAPTQLTEEPALATQRTVPTGLEETPRGTPAPTPVLTTASGSQFRSSGLDASIFNFRTRVPQIPSTRALNRRVETSSPIFQSSHRDAAPPRSAIHGIRKRRTVVSSANATLIGIRMPLGEVSTNRRAVSYATDIGATKTVFESDSDHMQIDTTQGLPKRQSSTTDTSTTRVDQADKTTDTLQPCATVEEVDGNVSMAESAGDGGSELSRLTHEAKLSGTSRESILIQHPNPLNTQ